MIIIGNRKEKRRRRGRANHTYKKVKKASSSSYLEEIVIVNIGLFSPGLCFKWYLLCAKYFAFIER